MLNSTIDRVTRRIEDRSADRRRLYEERMARQHRRGVHRGELSCGNLAHGFAACGAGDKNSLKLMNSSNIGIVSSYNDMLSAHQPLEHFPELIKQAARGMGCTAQFAGGVPAMCDGVTQGQPGMELSLFSRDVIAMATAVALSHNMFDGALYLGVCDKIVPGLFIGAARFGHLPALFVPAGPMPSGLPNNEKSRIRHALCRGQGRPRCIARGGVGVLSQPRHLHLLRHRQLQPADAGDDGAAPAGHLLRQPRHPAARRHHPIRHRAGHSQ